ncbi:carboxypeptidase-like regulatory domain-containing protein [Halobaculum sp. CBA1158]|uniref:carboxypeptidase-like regulatory domain-containing protein n=1 Tax=Halobaculum sp. CBA1158 TaxID=2904243 RepID=UPI001F317771|nr:carboxypeptidase regulatory-like domain-containing protein [Halobaculum sp. CBA1158]UIO98591.1 carboxypeptidase-like regulatory domain-containing protein [Halobaculum sp. CBA1158]
MVLATVVLLVAVPVVGVAGISGAAGVDGTESPVGSATAPPAATQEATVTITVAVETAAGDPVDDAEITAAWDDGTDTASTASNGRAFLDVPAGARVELGVDHPDYVLNAPVVIGNATEREVGVTVRERARLTVSVEDDSAEPVADARVLLRQDGEIVVDARTDADGTYTTGVIEQREYGLTVVKEGYYRSRTDVTVGADTTATVGVERGSVTLSFSVTDDRFDPPRGVADARIDLETAGTFTTLGNGEATAQVPVNAELDVDVTKEGYETVSRTVDVGESPRAVNLTIGRTPRLNLTAVNDRVVAGERTVVRVVDAYGDPVAGATVRVDGEAVGTTGDDGSLTVRFDAEGNHTVVAETDELTAEAVTVEVVSERTALPSTASPTATATATEPPDAATATPEPDAGISIPGFTPITAALAMVTLGALAAVRIGRSRRAD